MFQKALNDYLANYKGFSREIWILTLITFINRAGTMVLPFLSKYLKEDLNFDYDQVGWILFCYGLGSMLGSWLGGKLSDKIGFYKIMVFSLFTSGLAFYVLQFVKSFEGLCCAIFGIMVIADMFRPAMFVSIGTYAQPENRTRALTLVRLAINLGFAAGPALGGLIILGLGYQGLFWVDGTTCILAISIFALLVKEKKVHQLHPTEIAALEAERKSVFTDGPFWLFLCCCVITGILFFQLFTTIPLYHRIQFGLSELQTGLLLTLNGVLVFFLEMPIVSAVERNKVDKVKIVTWGCLFMSISLFLLLIDQWVGILIIMMLFMTFAEMFAFPFSNSFVISRAPKGHEGRYMAIFTMSYAAAHILSSKIGMTLVDYFGYAVNWLVMGVLGLLGTVSGYWVYLLVQREKVLHPETIKDIPANFEHPAEGGEREI